MKKVLSIILKVLLAIILAIVLAFVALMYVVPALECPKQTPVEGSEKWMAKLDDSLALSEITIPGTHDSATSNVQLAFITRCQSIGIGDQLKAGFRYLDIRLGVDEKAGKLKLMHGFTNCTKDGWPWSAALMLDEVLEECYAFLAENPTETVLFVVKYEHKSIPVADFEKMVNAVIEKHEDKWLLTDHIPTLGEARGKLVLFRRYLDRAELGAKAGIPCLWEEQKYRDDVSLHTIDENNGSYTLWVQDRFKYSVDEKWPAFAEGLKAAKIGKDAVSLNFLSTSGTWTYGHPYAYAAKLNERLLGLQDLSGWIIIDYATPELAAHIYNQN